MVADCRRRGFGPFGAHKDARVETRGPSRPGSAANPRHPWQRVEQGGFSGPGTGAHGAGRAAARLGWGTLAGASIEASEWGGAAESSMGKSG